MNIVSSECAGVGMTLVSADYASNHDGCWVLPVSLRDCLWEVRNGKKKPNHNSKTHEGFVCEFGKEECFRLYFNAILRGIRYIKR